MNGWLYGSNNYIELDELYGVNEKCLQYRSIQRHASVKDWLGKHLLVANKANLLHVQYVLSESSTAFEWFWKSVFPGFLHQYYDQLGCDCKWNSKPLVPRLLQDRS